MTDDKRQPLFREQLTAQRRRAAYGDVVLKGSLSSWVITGLLAVILIAGGLYLTLATVQTNNGAITLWHWLWSLS